jgi:hypothetical protein
MELKMDTETKFRICLNGYLAQLGYGDLTKGQKDYVFEKAWWRYGLIGFSFDEILLTFRRQSLDAEFRVYVRNSKKAENA